MFRESIEGVRVHTETLTIEEFKERFVVDGILDQRIFSTGLTRGAFTFFDANALKFKNSWVSTVSINDLVVGVAHIIKNPHEQRHLKLLSIDVDHNLIGLRTSNHSSDRALHLARRLLREVFTLVHSRHLGLDVSAFTDAGEERLAPIMRELSQAMGVPIRIPLVGVAKEK